MQTSGASKWSSGGSGSWGLHVLTRLELLILWDEVYPWSVCCLMSWMYVETLICTASTVFLSITVSAQLQVGGFYLYCTHVCWFSKRLQMAELLWQSLTVFSYSGGKKWLLFFFCFFFASSLPQSLVKWHKMGSLLITILVV